MGSKFVVISNIFLSLGPAILISMAYIDLGKWVAAIEGGAHFGFDLVLPVLIFNFIAILCQYLSAGISMVTGKNLAEICSEEYCRMACILLGVLAEVSMIISDFTMVLGIAHGLSLLFDMDFFSCICVAIIGAFLLPFLLTLLDNRMFEAVYVSIGGLSLLFYVFGVLISQPEVPVITDEIFPKLTGENAYSLMALLGANIMAHNFYVHSSIVQQQRRLSNVSTEALFHDHLFAIVFIFTAIFLVNYVLITSAAAVFGSADLLAPNFQDLSSVMEQIFKNPVAPAALLLVLFFSCQITAFTRNIGEQVILQHLFGSDLSVLAHHMLVKSLAAILAFFCARTAGAEGIYESFMVCQIILGMLLPSSSIPLFRVASSRSLMGSFKTSWYTEMLALLAFLGMLGTNVFFIAEILFDNSRWVANLRESNGRSTIILYAFLLLGVTSICVTFYLAVTPLKSASSKSDMQIYVSNSQKDLPALSDGIAEDNLEMIKCYEDQDYVAEVTYEKSVESLSDKSIIEYNPDMQVAVDSEVDLQHSAYGSNPPLSITSATHFPEGTTPTEGHLDIEYKSSARHFPCEVTISQVKSEEPVATVVTSEPDIRTERNNDEGDALENESLKSSIPSLNSEGPRSPNIVKGMSKDCGNGSGSLSKLLGLGRAGRRQLTVILDEFWGNLFDFHGKLTQDASSNRLDILLGLDLNMASSGKADATAAESSSVLFPDADKGQYFQTDLRDYSSPRQKKVQGADFPFNIQVGTSSWSQNMQQAEAHIRNSCSNMFDPTERSYSSLHLPLGSDNRDYQPATIHGYQIASYLRGISTSRSPAICSPSLPPTNKFSTSYVSSLRDQVMYGHSQTDLGSLETSSLQIPALSRINTVQVERPHYEPSLMEPSEHSVSSSYTKKYHSSPDISAIIASARNSYLNEGKKQSIPIGPRTSFDKILSEQSRYLNPLSRGAPLAFDELSPSNIQRDVFPLKQSLNQETRSLFSRQPFEELLGMVRRDQGCGGQGAASKPSITAEETFPYAESEAKLLHSLRICIMKLLNLDGSDWLFSKSGGPDEELIDQVAVAEKCLHLEKNEISLLPNCGDVCVWRAALVVSFGVWCIRRILDLSLVESRPELWGKYTYVLNRLQGIIVPAFLKSRQPLKPCTCIDMSVKCLTNFNSQLKNWTPPVVEKRGESSLTTASMILELIKDVETAVSGRKGRTGTAAGDVAFPKGKENLASVLKRYKRRLLSKPQGSHEGTSGCS
ncbi:Ethylene-insensitive protein 2 [Apostasia shenzhenica]|uniref:Ethylene-insensitive protein 2 n=1 Tax=Apostasia shenzhenica TaxID=1088818 RepID=A0A2I0AN53_9ASPA|nr:Ethylene-insensitive protein 2 [Apostasia shenzhenica]